MPTGNAGQGYDTQMRKFRFLGKIRWFPYFSACLQMYNAMLSVSPVHHGYTLVCVTRVQSIRDKWILNVETRNIPL